MRTRPDYRRVVRAASHSGAEPQRATCQQCPTKRLKTRATGRPTAQCVLLFFVCMCVCCFFLGGCVVCGHVGDCCVCSSCHFHYMCDVIGTRQDVGVFPNSPTPQHTTFEWGGRGSLD